MRLISFFIIATVFCSCANSDLIYHKTVGDWEETQLPPEDPAFSLYMIGDVGDDTIHSKPVLDNLQKRILSHQSSKAGVIFMGDNIYPEGLHKKSSLLRAEDEVRINVQLDVVKSFDGEVLFIPGNHDWDRQGEGGLKHVKRQEDYIESYLDKGNAFVPSHGCPGPEVIKLTPGLVLIVIDTQWWVHKFDRASGEKDGCDVRNSDELMVHFTDLLKKYRNQNVIVAGHHPLYSNGEHGGKFKLGDYFFPLRALNPKAYVPLPVLGAIYPLYRKFIGHSQDITHPVYQDMKNKLVAAMSEYDNVVYVSGHDHNLQHSNEGAIHHFISGSGSKVTFVRKNSDILFGAMNRGYCRFKYYEDGQVWVEFMVTDPDTRVEQIVYRNKLFTGKSPLHDQSSLVEKHSYEGMTALVVPDSSYEAGGLKRMFFGDLNRDLWTTPLTVPYLDIHYEAGGLVPIKKGGGLQTLSLRMQGADGLQYTLRGVQKSATFLTAKNLRGTVAQDILYDGMAGSHPYASVVVPELSEAVGIYHSNPRLVYVPDDPILGEFRADFGNRFCQFEERPDGDMSDYPSFGNSKKVLNYTDAVEKLHREYDHVIDKDYIVAARLFDMVIGDWDRHDDQWRWATFKEDGKHLYRPIPRDRDQVFFKFNGLFMQVANRKWLIPKFQPFTDDIRDISGQNFNARFFDRAFMVEADKDVWLAQAIRLQAALTDEVIENAVQNLPAEGFAVTGDEIISTLKSRRDKLSEFAERYYKELAKSVNVQGTYDEDYFDIVRNDDGSVEVSVYPRKKGNKQKKKRFFHRIFYPDETNEIRLYGIEGDDEYQLKGKVKSSILVRIIAGGNSDRFEDKSTVNGLRKMTQIYDSKGVREIKKSKETRVRLMKDEKAYDYDRRAFDNNVLAPAVSIGFNPNDGFYIGPGFKYIAHGFEKHPHQFVHRLVANRSFGSEGFNAFYHFDYVDAVGKADFGFNADFRYPLVFQYFGAGNEVDEIENELTEDFKLFDVEMNHIELAPYLEFSSRGKAQNLRAMAGFEYVDFRDIPLTTVDDWELQSQRFFNGAVSYSFVNQDHEHNPNRGLQLNLGAKYTTGTGSAQVDFVQLRGEVIVYTPINLFRRQITLGLRSGVSSNLGDYAFYQANFISGFDNFRGVLRTRFAGHTAFYNNVDLRLSLFKVPNYIAPFDVGVLGHADAARVWVDGEDSELYHVSYGGGVFFTILDSFMISGTYSLSNVDEVLLIGTSFFF